MGLAAKMGLLSDLVVRTCGGDCVLLGLRGVLFFPTAKGFVFGPFFKRAAAADHPDRGRGVSRSEAPGVPTCGSEKGPSVNQRVLWEAVTK